jgi:F0F1-type ATP synthase membrane subunit b/b'
MANATIVRQKNSIEIMEKRLEEMRDMIVQYGGQEKLEELRAQVQSIKSQSEKKSQFSEQEIGKDTISTSTAKKDEAQERQQKDEQQIIQESQKNFGELE